MLAVGHTPACYHQTGKRPGSTAVLRINGRRDVTCTRQKLSLSQAAQSCRSPSGYYAARLPHTRPFVAPCSIVQGFKVSNADEGVQEVLNSTASFRYQPSLDFFRIQTVSMAQLRSRGQASHRSAL